MKNFTSLLFILFLFTTCNKKSTESLSVWTPYNESSEIAQNANHESPRMRYKLIQSKNLDKNEIWKTVKTQMVNFSEKDYLALYPFIFNQDIPTLQENIKNGKLTYEQLTKWYLYRIMKFENDSQKTLHSIISLNPKAIALAKACDKNKSKSQHPIFGMPILIKDNINTTNMKTTAGAVALKDNQTGDAFIVKRIKAQGGIILGKANLSEWAYFFCSGCPLGYSAIGGQTLNPYGRKKFETGGSSAGSGTTMAANYAAAAIGTETSGSILSPSSQNSIVGLKPTIGLLSRTGIVPISSTLDTPGPMTRNVMDNAILLSAMTGEDAADAATKDNPKNKKYWENLTSASLKGMRLGANKSFLENKIYSATLEKLKSLGATIVEFEPEQMNFEKFVVFLNADMKEDLPKYLSQYAGSSVKVRTVGDVVKFNLEDTMKRSPYGQALFEGIVAEDISAEDFAQLKKDYEMAGRNFFDTPMQAHNLDAILSINNYNAGHAAMAKYPALAVPMGYKESGEPINLTFIAKPFEEDKLLKLGYAFEQGTKVRKVPKGYE